MYLHQHWSVLIILFDLGVRQMGQSSQINQPIFLKIVAIPCAPLHSRTEHWYTPKLYISMTLYQFQINMQIFRAATLFTYFRSHDLSFKVEHIFVTNFCFIFWGCFRKMVIKSLIISVDPYMIPHFKTNEFFSCICINIGVF